MSHSALKVLLLSMETVQRLSSPSNETSRLAKDELPVLNVPVTLAEQQ